MPHAPREPSRPPRTPQSLRGESPFQTESAKVDREVLRDATRPLVSTPTTDREVLRDAVRPLVSTPTTGRKGTVASPSETVMFLTASHGTPTTQSVVLNQSSSTPQSQSTTLELAQQMSPPTGGFLQPRETLHFPTKRFPKRSGQTGHNHRKAATSREDLQTPKLEDPGRPQTTRQRISEIQGFNPSRETSNFPINRLPKRNGQKVPRPPNASNYTGDFQTPGFHFLDGHWSTQRNKERIKNKYRNK